MSNERIVFTNPDGSCSVEVPSPNYLANGGSMEELEARVISREGVTNVRRITTAELPQDRLFRNAWDDSNPEEFVGLNLPKAQEIAHEIRRVKRQEELEPLDIEERNIRTTPQRKNEIVAEKTAILDKYDFIQTEIDACMDEDTLRLVLTNSQVI